MEKDAARGAGRGGIRPRRGLSLALAAGVFLSGCASSDTRIVGQYPGASALQDWRTIANTNLPERGEILKVVDLGRSGSLSNHLAIIQSRELPHRHNRHDSTVTLLRGHGTMTVGRETRHVREGAVIFIPRGVVHHFSNESDSPSVALVVYAPPFDGRDREIVTGTGTEDSPDSRSSGEGSPEPPADLAPEPDSSPAPEEAAPPPESLAPAEPETPPADLEAPLAEPETPPADTETTPAEPETPLESAPSPLEAPIEDWQPEAAPPADGAGAGEPGAPATPEEEPVPAPPQRDPVFNDTESAPDDSGRPGSSPGAVIEGTPEAPPPPAP